VSHDSYEEPGGSLRRATAVASRDGGLLAYDSGEVYEPGGRVPASRLFDDDDLTERLSARVLNACTVVVASTVKPA
jgi:hypothetical protein